MKKYVLESMKCSIYPSYFIKFIYFIVSLFQLPRYKTAYLLNI